MMCFASGTLASQYGRCGYRRITALLQRAGWQVGKDRVERIWRREGAEGSTEADHKKQPIGGAGARVTCAAIQ
jgi:HTH-like domain